MVKSLPARILWSGGRVPQGFTQESSVHPAAQDAQDLRIMLAQYASASERSIMSCKSLLRD